MVHNLFKWMQTFMHDYKCYVDMELLITVNAFEDCVNSYVDCMCGNNEEIMREYAICCEIKTSNLVTAKH